jgi:hypothetical protein
LESIINRKKRINDRNVLRNGLEYRTPGEKSYKNPECSNNFYKIHGGLIPGSSLKEAIVKSVNRKECNSFDTLDFSMCTLQHDRLWRNKVKSEVIDNDALYVKTLTQWDKQFFKNNQAHNQIIQQVKHTNKKIK